jgi:hypothetical protein
LYTFLTTSQIASIPQSLPTIEALSAIFAKPSQSINVNQLV